MNFPETPPSGRRLSALLAWEVQAGSVHFSLCLASTGSSIRTEFLTRCGFCSYVCVAFLFLLLERGWDLHGFKGEGH
jgi:hypothetical protein